MGSGPAGKRKLGRRFKRNGAWGACGVQCHGLRQVGGHRDLSRADDTGPRGATFNMVTRIARKEVLRRGQAMLRRPKLAMKIQFISVDTLGIIVFMQTNRQTRHMSRHGSTPARNVRVIQVVKTAVQVLPCPVRADIECQANRIEKRDQNRIAPAQFLYAALRPFQ